MGRGYWDWRRLLGDDFHGLGFGQARTAGRFPHLPDPEILPAQSTLNSPEPLTMTTGHAHHQLSITAMGLEWTFGQLPQHRRLGVERLEVPRGPREKSGLGIRTGNPGH